MRLQVGPVHLCVGGNAAPARDGLWIILEMDQRLTPNIGISNEVLPMLRGGNGALLLPISLRPFAPYLSVHAPGEILATIEGDPTADRSGIYFNALSACGFALAPLSNRPRVERPS